MTDRHQRGWGDVPRGHIRGQCRGLGHRQSSGRGRGGGTCKGPEPGAACVHRSYREGPLWLSGRALGLASGHTHTKKELFGSQFWVRPGTIAANHIPIPRRGMGPPKQDLQGGGRGSSARPLGELGLCPLGAWVRRDAAMTYDSSQKRSEDAAGQGGHPTLGLPGQSDSRHQMGTQQGRAGREGAPRAGGPQHGGAGGAWRAPAEQQVRTPGQAPTGVPAGDRRAWNAARPRVHGPSSQQPIW